MVRLGNETNPVAYSPFTKLCIIAQLFKRIWPPSLTLLALYFHYGAGLYWEAVEDFSKLEMAPSLVLFSHGLFMVMRNWHTRISSCLKVSH